MRAAVNFKYSGYFRPTRVIFPFISLIVPFPPLFYVVFPSLESPGSEDSPLGSPHLVVNGNGSVNGQGGGSGSGPGPSPEGRQLSPLTSPLLMDAGCVRNDDDEEARRKVGDM